MADLIDLAIEELQKRVDAAGSRAAAAKELNISPSQLSDVLNRRRDFSRGMLEKMGFDKVVIHIKKQDKSKLVKAIEPTVVTFKHF
jgi:hypothetical protein